MPLFNFTLAPLDKVQPWGEPGDQSLHWFGLTDGIYWIEAGSQKLFEYHADNPWGIDGLRYVDYQVVRLYEDIISIVPTVLAPIPEWLQKEIAGEGFRTFNNAYEMFLNSEHDSLDEEEIWATASTANLYSERILDSGYLNPPSRIWLWSDAANVHIEWDNRDCIHEGKPVWSTQQGEFLLSRAAFIDEVRDFHNCLMQQMQERVNQVCAGALPPEVRIDLAALREEHERRSVSIESLFAPPAEPTDWKAVERAIAEIKRPRAL